MNRFTALLVLSAFFGLSAQARTTTPLTCAYSAGQNLFAMKNGILVESFENFANGKLISDLILVTYKNGKASRQNMDGRIRLIEKSKAISDSLTAPIFKKARKNINLIDSARALTLGAGQPAPLLVNYFDKDQRFITGAILVPGGETQLCYPVKAEL